jgi:hypothetical protein
MSEASVGRGTVAVVAAFALFGAWTLATWILEGRIETLLRPEAALDRAATDPEYLRRYGPVGCRDLATLSFLKEHDVPAYFSGCLTLTLPRERTQRTDEIFLVDLDQASLASLPPEVVRQGTRLTHGTRQRDTQERFAMARGLRQDWK